MGRERNRKRQHIYFCAVGLISFLLAACAPVRTLLDQKDCGHLHEVQDLIGQGDFGGALRLNQKALALSPGRAGGDAALFSSGLIHLHGANPEKDPKKALESFHRLRKEFPDSPLAEESRIWIDVLEAWGTEESAKGSLDHLRQIQDLLRQGDLESAMQQNRKVLSLSPDSPPADAALFSMGLVHIHYANPIKDYSEALGAFKQLQNRFPESPLAEEAKIWVGVLEAMAKAMQIDLEIEEKKKEMTR